MNIVDTSIEALDKIRDVAPLQRRIVFDAVYARGERGATADELHQTLNIEYNSLHPRLRELVQDEELVMTSEKRKTRSGRNARVYKTVGFARAA